MDELGEREIQRRRRFDRLYDAHHARLLGFVLRRTDSPDAAADVLAETFLVAWRRLEQVPDGEETRLWLYAVALRMRANHGSGTPQRTSLADRLRHELTVALPAVPGPMTESPTAVAFASLCDADRELLALVDWEGLDAGEISVVLGCSVTAVRIRLGRARHRLRAALTAGDGVRPAADPVALVGGGS